MVARNDEKAKEKKEELEESLKTKIEAEFGELSDEEIDRVVESISETALRVKGPEVEPIYCITASETGGRSTKPGNIQFRPTKVLEMLASGTFTVGATTQMPVLAHAAAVMLWVSVLRSLSEEITAQEGFVYWVIWKNRSENGITRKSKFPDLALEELEEQEVDIYLDEREVEKAISKLKSIKAIQDVKRGSVEYYHAREFCRVKWR